MCEEWAKWKGQDVENKKYDDYEYQAGWVEEPWVADWSQPRQAWDRLAVLDGNVSKAQLQDKATTQAATTPMPKDEGNEGNEDIKTTKKTKRKAPQVEEVTKEDVEVPLPTSEKDQVKAIAAYLKDIKAGGWKIKKPEDLTEDIKREFKKPFPPTDECRLNVYWKLANVGLHLKTERKDIVTFSVHVDVGPYLFAAAFVLESCGFDGHSIDTKEIYAIYVIMFIIIILIKILDIEVDLCNDVFKKHYCIYYKFWLLFGFSWVCSWIPPVLGEIHRRKGQRTT